MQKQLTQIEVTDNLVESSRQLNHLLSGMGGDATWYCKSFNPFPVVLSKAEFELQLRIQRALKSAIEKIVANYFKDQRLLKIISQPEDALKLLSKLDGSPYKIGTYRPDFVHDLEGIPRVCEINARFPCNAYFITHYLSKAFESLTVNSHLRCMAMEGLRNVPSLFLNRFSNKDRLAVVKGREKGWDIHFFMHELKKKCYSCDLISTSELIADASRDGLIYELHQDELLHEGIWSALKDVVRDLPQLNDLRTILIVHDKRFLSIFHDADIVDEYLDRETAHLLRQHVIPTYVVGRSPGRVEEAKQNQNDWVLKPNLFGKGEGLLIGRNTPKDQWEASLSDEKSSNYVLQQFIDQKKFSIRMLVDGRVEIVNLNIVGTLLCFDDEFVGTGIYRASPNDIVNVAGGGAILFPMLSGNND